MIKKITLVIFIFSIAYLQAQEIKVDSSLSEIKIELKKQLEDFDNKLELQTNQLGKEISEINANIKKVSILYKEQSKLVSSINDSLSRELIVLAKTVKELDSTINKIELSFNENISNLSLDTENLKKVSDGLRSDLKNANIEVTEIRESSSSNSTYIQTVEESLSQKQQYGLIIIGFSLVLILMVYIILSKKWTSDTKKLAAKQKEIFEKQIQDSQQIADWFSSESSKNLAQNKSGEVDHSFAKRVADEMVRITTNLSRMDDSIKGYKQLSASVKKLEQSLNANQYELVDLINKPYHDGMNLEVNFINDDNLKKDERIITRIIKPQINYKGKLIQAAHVEVSVGE